MNWIGDPCPPQEERSEAMQTWSCDEINQYYKLEWARIVINYVTMGPQVLLYLGLIFALVRMRYRGTGQVTCMSILICVFALLNGILSIIRVNERFLDFYVKGEGFIIYQTTYGLESICFIGAVWFYSIIYLQTARDIKRLIIFTTTPT